MLLQKKINLACGLLLSLSSSQLLFTQNRSFTRPIKIELQLKIKNDISEKEEDPFEIIFNGAEKLKSLKNEQEAKKTHSRDVIISVGSYSSTLYADKSIRIAEIYLLGILNRTYDNNNQGNFSLNTEEKKILASMLTEEEKLDLDTTAKKLLAPWVKKINDQLNSNSAQNAATQNSKEIVKNKCTVS